MFAIPLRGGFLFNKNCLSTHFLCVSGPLFAPVHERLFSCAIAVLLPEGENTGRAPRLLGRSYLDTIPNSPGFVVLVHNVSACRNVSNISERTR